MRNPTLSEPAWWYQAEPTLAARTLAPVARLWARAAEQRYARGTAYKAPVPVICVGNFTAGGTGKTPLSIHIAQDLAQRGAAPAFLSRGYGGRIAGPHWVAREVDRAADVGDEPLLLANVAPTLIARDRALGARRIAEAAAPDGAIVMDDGLQNGSVEKSLAIAVVDGRRGIGNGLVMPAGPLRAALQFQLGLIDAVVVTSPQGDAASEHPFAAWLRENFGGPVMTASTAPRGDTEWLKGRPVLAFSGIGAPDRFFGLLERLGGQIAARRAFADHHPYSEAEARALMDEASRLGATLCTTEKDWVRLERDGAQGALRAEARVLAIRAEFDERDRLRLSGLIEGSLSGGGLRSGG
ncbi:MAG: tetraacyldisaccharide 4'-kinase [Proteobacteria bacterium]|nr:tetraacyldisaccharide 4'-kinase [Pseudomonadota bacterium]